MPRVPVDIGSIPTLGIYYKIEKIYWLSEGESTLNGERYLKILQRYLLQNYPNLKEQKLIYQHDNAPAHCYHRIIEWLEAKDVQNLNWPPQSPDLNLIEDVWNEIKFRLRGKAFENKDKLWKAVKKEWQNVSKSFIKNLYESLPRRIEALKNAKGSHTKY